MQLKKIFILLFFISFYNFCFSDTIFINKNYFDDINFDNIIIDTGNFYFCDTTIIEVDVFIIEKFLNKFYNREEQITELKNEHINNYIYNYFTASNINIRIVEKIFVYIENNSLKLSGIKYIEFK